MNRLQVLTLLALLGFISFYGSNSQSAAEDAVASDAKAIFGYWQCTEATYKGKPFRKYVGTVYLIKDRLRIRSADDPQPLSFDRTPKGKWNESIFKRISAEAAHEQIKKLKAAADDE